MPNPVPVTLSDLTTPTTPDEALQLSLSICQQLGLPTQAWQPIQMIPTVIETNATLAADSSGEVALIAQGAYASLAAQMVDATGAPITTWMALRATDQYGITPGPATFASGPVPYTNTSAATYPYSPNNPLHAQNPTTGATYTSTGTGNVSPGSSTVSFQADVAGSSGTSGTGVTLTLTTPLAGVTLTALTASLVGSNAESNQALLTRGTNKLSTLAPVPSTQGTPSPIANDGRGIYDFLARSIPQAASFSTVPPYAVTSPITRTTKSSATGTGLMTLWIANSQGAPSANDVSVIQAACNALVTGDGILLTAVAAVPLLVSITATIYLRSSSGITAAAATTNIEDALANFFSTVPIGGVTTSRANIIPFADILQTIFDANRGTVDVDLTIPATDTSVATNAVASLAPSPNITIVFVS